jgi:hypothetical protein
MGYSSGGTITYTDYNNLVGTSTTTTAGQLNAVWAVGTGNSGYGQTAISQSAATGGLVTATQWSTLVNALNAVESHQTGSTASNISLMTQGQTITYLSAVTTNINAVTAAPARYTGLQGTKVTGSTVAATTISAANNATYGPTVFCTRTVTFAGGADAARYFFNAGGQIDFAVTGVTNNDSTARSTDAVNVILTYFGGMTGFKAAANGQKTGSGGSQTGSYTSGYYSLTSSDQTICTVTTSSSTYSGDYVTLNVKSNGTQGSNGDKGTVITFTLVYYSAHTVPTSGATQGSPPGGSSGDTLNVTASTRIDITPPAATYLSNTWGTITVA